MDDIIRYVIECRKRGFNDDYIKKSLKDAGHQDFIIEEALLKSGVPKNQGSKKSFPLKTASIISIMIIALALPLIFVEFGSNTPTGHVVEDTEKETSLSTPTEEEVEKLLEKESAIKVKNEIINEQIKTIEDLNVSLERKQELIEQQTKKVNALINKLEHRRERTVNASLELIDSILSR